MRKLATRASWNLIDQGIYSLANMFLSIVVARHVGDESFGAFAIGFLIYGIGVAVAKSASGQPLQIHHSADSIEQFREATARANGATLAMGLLGSAICLLAGLGIGGAVGHVLLALAPCLPALMVQDNFRMAFFANGQPHLAALIDVIKAVLQFGFLFALVALGWTEVGILTLSWGVAGVLSAIVGALLLRSWPRLSATGDWFRDKRDLVKYLFGMYVLGLGAAQLGQLLIPVLGSTRDSGSIRGVDTLRGPLNVLGQAALAFAVPEISRRAEMGPKARMRGMWALSIGTGLLSAFYVTVLLLIPHDVGLALLNETWDGTREVILPMGVLSVVASFTSGAGALLLGMGLARRTFRINVLKAPLLLAMLIPGTYFWGAFGAAWSMALAEIIIMPFWYWAAIRGAYGHYDHEIERDHASEASAEKAKEDNAS
ncbi:hypothetical protein GZ178_10975 [Dermatophilus congolensis]|uniref:hypothetical protein n=2 Tax=Dermatophilus congolensis TaxID=1863 RepID=UPI001AAE6853|nr:hypothetical protein [Dermatophilus congolensis]MBO3184578.1 hypothetical protein [Dermatophilus congolensis]MBO3200577.1 hypothetical protein [Dermatophilus congolensis]